jgi:hypothetical protein
MKIKDLADYKNDEIKPLLARIPFFKQLQVQAGNQLGVLLNYSYIVELDAGETIMRRGDRGSWLYCLIKGRLNVYLNETHQSRPLSYITPGELFGDLALLGDHERKATVAAEAGSKKALLFATDFKPFGDLANFNLIDLNTKLVFYRTMVHSIRWRLEVNRMEHPMHPLAALLRHVPTYSGAKGVDDELYALFDQAQFLASVLDRWNADSGATQNDFVTHASNS